jgi:hypothetical protein
MTTPYNTGKVQIGAAYTPRIKPETSHGITGPHKRPFFDTADWLVVRVALFAVLAAGVIMALSGCERPIDPVTGTKTVDMVMGPDEHGVVCYLEIGPNNRSLSCVKVR